ncbi:MULTISPECIES: PPE family protein [unclassified Mycolicibacterium]|uniref:PPE family protein n=1 Tax=unclassified Mycolicibacterium TaxID=2636767 RepID=UPI0012DEBE40|nr:MULTISPECIES: PPE family protein [unclassified Mycolicibacterium]MUL82857.1 PPE family protein [Mycolicibacterium sp. CBMA 329]MUL89192.1 PPE family protein [Mycolicibacterium sp. CBMA 331]MUL97759.1 PPE family protein [Mycolicibacterium sp. CBMA 334]MUM25128.1 PPE family protein [Mycolicibacterium sp. CBMA 295]MUM38708.1 PPE family protein [Mycolicibacterium sp. CBMA 247]
MVAAPPVPPTWFALPPEVNTARLMVGAGPAPMLQAATGWEGLAILLETQADELAGALSNLTSVWNGTASERAVSATMPMIMWLRTMVLQAQKRALQAGAQASSYTLALTTTPPIPEIEQNHVTNAVLNATNFLGINTMPIGLNEMDYFVRMWNQAADAMEAYHAETTLNLLFEPIMPMTPIVLPGIGETTAASALAATAPRTAEGLMRNAVVEGISAQATIESVGLVAGNAAAQANHAEQRAVGAANKGENAAQQKQSDKTEKNPMQQGMQMAMQMGQQAGQIAGQIPQMLQSPMQAMTQPLQQVTQMVSQFSSMGGSDRGMQVGLMGAMPFSNHPLAGGTGPSSGAGLVRAASLPGALGSPPRTALLSSMLGISGEAKPVASGVASGAAGPVAPVGGGGGGAPMTGAGHNDKKSGGGTKDGMVAPTALTYDISEDADDDW